MPSFISRLPIFDTYTFTHSTRRWLPLIGAVILASIATIVVTWPQFLAPTKVVDHFDPYFSVWRLGHIAHALKRWPIALFDANIFYPAKGTLAYSDATLLEGVLAAPLFWAGVEPTLIYNVLLYAGFVLSGAAIFVCQVPRIDSGILHRRRDLRDVAARGRTPDAPRTSVGRIHPADVLAACTADAVARRVCRTLRMAPVRRVHHYGVSCARPAAFARAVAPAGTAIGSFSKIALGVSPFARPAVFWPHYEASRVGTQDDEIVQFSATDELLRYQRMNRLWGGPPIGGAPWNAAFREPYCAGAPASSSALAPRRDIRSGCGNRRRAVSGTEWFGTGRVESSPLRAFRAVAPAIIGFEAMLAAFGAALLVTPRPMQSAGLALTSLSNIEWDIPLCLVCREAR